MTTHRSSRRGWLTRMGALLGGVVFGRASHADLTGTPRAAEGPFYPTPSMRVADTDNDLVKVDGVVTEAGGEIVNLKGRVIDKHGTPLSGLRVEIWQCDVNGTYLHTGDPRSTRHDNAFQGFGHDITDANGEYRFRTIKPSRYPGRTPHIHVKVCTDEKELLTTQFYIEGEPDNDKDSLYRRLSTEEVASVSMVFVRGYDAPEATVDIVV